VNAATLVEVAETDGRFGSGELPGFRSLHQCGSNRFALLGFVYVQVDNGAPGFVLLSAIGCEQETGQVNTRVTVRGVDESADNNGAEERDTIRGHEKLLAAYRGGALCGSRTRAASSERHSTGAVLSALELD